MHIDPKEIIYQPIPQDKIAQARRYARDLAWLYVNEYISEIPSENGYPIIHPHTEELMDYVNRVWKGKPSRFALLRTLNFVQELSPDVWRITEKAVLLLEDSHPASIFISYSRTESSPLALLIVARLKEHGLSAFLDMHPDREGLAVGDDWHAKLEEVVASNDNFIVLIGQKTLNSPYVRQEIEWARKYNKAIFPVWHNGFRGLDQNVSYEVTEAIQYVVGTVNATIVEAENPKQYNAALDELLSSFGIVP